MHHSSMSWEKSPLYFFSWNFIWFLQREPTKVQNFRLSTAQVKFHQICILIGSFCWKYIKFQLRKYWIVVQNLKEKQLFVSKMTKIGWILIQALKSLKHLHLNDPFCAKYITFDLKKYRGVIFHDTEESCKIWRKTDM